MLTKEQLEQVKRRCEAATPGPWEFGSYGIWGREDGRMVKVLRDPQNADDEPIIYREEDYDFIIACRTDIPALLQHVEEQRSLLRRAQSVIAAHSECYPDCCGYCPDKATCSSKAVLDEIAMYDNPKAGAGTL